MPGLAPERTRRCALIVVSGLAVLTFLLPGVSAVGAAARPGPKPFVTTKIPKSMRLNTAPPEKRGPEVVGVPSAPLLSDLHDAAIGQNIDGIQCNSDEQVILHIHTHLSIFVNGQPRMIPYGIGIPGFQTVRTKYGPYVATSSCWYWLHTHADDGVIHIEVIRRNQHFTLGQFFDIWGVPLSATQVGPAMGPVTAFLNGQVVHGNLRDLPLASHDEIQLDVGSPLAAPYKVKSWGAL